MRSSLASVAACCLLLTSVVDAQEIIFSHRAYLAHGRSYQQLWLWSADNGTLKQVSSGERDHRFPLCEADGRHVTFDGGRWPAVARWRLDRLTGAEQSLNAPGFGYALMRRINPSTAPAECEADTARASADGTRLACAATNGTDILIADNTRHEIARVGFGQRYSNGDPYAPWPMDSTWSPDGRTLLVGNYGENGGSTTGELDYFLLDLTTRAWTRAFTGLDALWLTPTLIVYVTPRDLSPLVGGGTHSVWTAHLAAFNPVSRVTRPITSGLSSDMTPAVCSR